MFPRLLRFIAVIVIGLWLPGCAARPRENSLVGKSEAAILMEFGQSHSEFAGHYGSPPVSFVEKFRGEVKTMIFDRRGGDLYVSFEKRNGVWTAICNSFLAKGSMF
jgi:hypothetical protein